MRDLDAIGTLLLGIIVFGILAFASPAWSSDRYVTPNTAEKICVNYVGIFSIYRTLPPNDPREAAAMEGIRNVGMTQHSIDALLAEARGETTAGKILPVLFKLCMAQHGDPVV